MEKKTDIESVEQASKNFEKIRKSVTGLLEILNITLSDNGNEFYFNLALENIDGFYQNFLELILNEQGLPKFLRELRHSDIEVGIPYGEILKEKLKDLKQKSTHKL
ncbi:MAG: hypothetical protein ACFE78_12755 [Candidatus Hodarchaeota archaeon]